MLFLTSVGMSATAATVITCVPTNVCADTASLSLVVRSDFVTEIDSEMSTSLCGGGSSDMVASAVRISFSVPPVNVTEVVANVTVKVMGAPPPTGV